MLRTGQSAPSRIHTGRTLCRQGRFYFLPDAYAIARLASSPHSPALNITTSGSDPATLSITLTFLALPVWDPGRVAAAASAPAGPLLSNFGISKITSLSILPATTTQLVLNLPSTDPSAGNAPVPVANATIDTANGIRGSVTLSLAQFQQVYDALFVTPSVLLSGKVNVTVDQDTEPVPFSGSASDFAGNILDTSLSYDPSANQLSVVATNAIESPIQVTALPVTLSQGGSTVPMNVASISPEPAGDAAAAATRQCRSARCYARRRSGIQCRDVCCRRHAAAQFGDTGSAIGGGPGH